MNKGFMLSVRAAEGEDDDEDVIAGGRQKFSVSVECAVPPVS